MMTETDAENAEMANRLPALRVLPAEPWGPDGADEARALLWGVDTLYLSFDLAVSEGLWAELERERQIAQEKEATLRAVHAPEWLGCVMRPQGAKGGYRFLLETDAWSIKLLRGVPNRPPIFVELRAFALKTHPRGVIGVCEEVCAYLRDVLLADQDAELVAAQVNVDVARCSRLDLHCDWQGGWHPTLAEGEQRLFIRPGQVDWHPFLSGNVCTGYVFGKGHVMARVYNKTRQARQTHADWYFTLLRAQNGAAYEPTQDVWRLEFELTRAGVKGFRLATVQEATDADDEIMAELEAEDLPSVGTVRKALHWAGRIWNYLTTRWLRLVVPVGADGDRTDSNRGRWPIHPTWALLRESFAAAMVRAAHPGAPLPEGKLQLVRAERHSGYRRLLERMATGVLATADLYDSDPGAVAGSWLAYMHRLAGLIRQKQEGRLLAWEARGAADGADGASYWAEAARHGRGASVDHLRKVEELLGMALGVFTSAGVVGAELPPVASVEELLRPLLADLEAIAAAKGGIGWLLIAKRAKVYKVSASARIFAAGAAGQAAPGRAAA